MNQCIHDLDELMNQSEVNVFIILDDRLTGRTPLT